MADQLQWGRRLSTAETKDAHNLGASNRCFNGAAVSQRRKPFLPFLRPSPVFQASMGPPSLNGGNEKMDTMVCTICGGFNGAAVSQRRKLCVQSREGSTRRRFNGAAVSQRRKRHNFCFPVPLTIPASMGPPSLNGGNEGP